MAATVKLFIVFFVSGVLHWVGEAVPVHSLMQPIVILAFFLLQVVAILGIQTVIELGTKSSLNIGTKWTTLPSHAGLLRVTKGGGLRSCHISAFY